MNHAQAMAAALLLSFFIVAPAFAGCSGWGCKAAGTGKVVGVAKKIVTLPIRLLRK